MNASNLITHDICANVLLRPFLTRLRPPQRFFQHTFISILHSTNPKVHPRTHLLNLYSWQFLSAPLRPNQVNSQMYNWFCLLSIHAIPRTNRYNILQTLNIDLVCWLSLEEVRKEALCESILIADRTLKRCSRKQQHRFQSNGALLVLKLAQRPKALRVQIQLQHIQHLMLKRPGHGDRMRAFLRCWSEEQDRSIILLAEEL